MAVSRKIPEKDIKQYEPKIVGPFTWHQLKWGVPGIALALFVFFSTEGLGDVAYLLAIVVGFPMLYCGFAKPYGMTAVQYIKRAFIPLFLAPSRRKYQTELDLPKNKVSQKSENKRRKYKNPEYKEI